MVKPRPSSVDSKAGPSARQLLAWYDRHRRTLPWRAKPGEIADPYRVWLSEIMLQQTTVTAVKPYFEKVLTLFPDVFALADAPTEAVMSAWAGLGYYSRARNLHACAKAVVEFHGGVFPDDQDALRALPGIGDYTSAAIASIAFNRVATVVDGNVERVMSRLYAVEEPLPGSKPRIKTLTAALVPEDRPGDFAQAMMDLGATLCSPKSPSCILCPFNGFCTAQARGDAETFPRKTPKKEGQLRRGAAFVLLRDDDAILVRTRPDKGLLGGMTEVPGTHWSADFKPKDALAHAPVDVEWVKLRGHVRHVFTHFPLELTIYVARCSKRKNAPKGARFVSLDALDQEALPSVMKKAIAFALENLSQ
jgi:A/G-specific adenine glycosylase